MTVKKCPWPAPPPGEILPKLPTTRFVEDAEIIRWFVAQHAPKKSIENSPIQRWLSNLEEIAKPATNAERRKGGAASKEERAALFDLHEAQKLAWSVRVLHSATNHKRVEIHASIVRDEILSTDMKGLSSRVYMPGGIGSLYQAARLLHCSGGRITIFGTLNPGADIRFEPEEGKVAFIERKDRAYAPGELDDLDSWARYFAGQVHKAMPKLKPRENGARVISVGFATSRTLGEQVQKMFRSLVQEVIESLSPEDCPDAVCGAFTIYDLESHNTDAEDKSAFLEIQRKGVPEHPHWASLKPYFRVAYDAITRKAKYK